MDPHICIVIKPSYDLMAIVGILHFSVYTLIDECSLVPTLCVGTIFGTFCVLWQTRHRTQSVGTRVRIVHQLRVAAPF